VIQNLNALKARIFEVLYTIEQREADTQAKAIEIIKSEASDLDSEQYDYLFNYVVRAVKNSPSLLPELNKYLRGWDIDRISSTARTAMLMGITDIIRCDCQKDGSLIGIDVATTLAKKYGGEEDANLVNGVLANFYERNKNE